MCFNRCFITALFLIIFTTTFCAVPTPHIPLSTKNLAASSIEQFLAEEMENILEFIQYEFDFQLYSQVRDQVKRSGLDLTRGYSTVLVTCPNFKRLFQPCDLEPTLYTPQMLRTSLDGTFDVKMIKAMLQYAVTRSRVCQKNFLQTCVEQLVIKIICDPQSFQKLRTLSRLSRQIFQHEREGMKYLYVTEPLASHINVLLKTDILDFVDAPYHIDQEIIDREFPDFSMRKGDSHKHLETLRRQVENIQTNGCILQCTGKIMFSLLILADFNYARTDTLSWHSSIMHRLIRQDFEREQELRKKTRNTQHDTEEVLESKLRDRMELQLVVTLLNQLRAIDIVRSKTKHRFLENRAIVGIQVLKYLLNYQDTTDLSKTNDQGCLVDARLSATETLTENQKSILDKIKKLETFLETSDSLLDKPQPVTQYESLLPLIQYESAPIPTAYESTDDLSITELQNMLKLQEAKLVIKTKTLVEEIAKLDRIDLNVDTQHHYFTDYARGDLQNASYWCQTALDCNPNMIESVKISDLPYLHPTRLKNERLSKFVTHPITTLTSGLIQAFRMQEYELKANMQNVQSNLVKLSKCAERMTRFIVTQSETSESQKVRTETEQYKQNQNIKQFVCATNTTTSYITRTRLAINDVLDVLKLLESLCYNSFKEQDLTAQGLREITSPVKQLTTRIRALLKPIEAQIVSAKVINLDYTQIELSRLKIGMRTLQNINTKVDDCWKSAETAIAALDLIDTPEARGQLSNVELRTTTKAEVRAKANAAKEQIDKQAQVVADQLWAARSLCSQPHSSLQQPLTTLITTLETQQKALNSQKLTSIQKKILTFVDISKDEKPNPDSDGANNSNNNLNVDNKTQSLKTRNRESTITEEVLYTVGTVSVVSIITYIGYYILNTDSSKPIKFEVKTSTEPNGIINYSQKRIARLLYSLFNRLGPFKRVYNFINQRRKRINILHT